MVLQDGVLSCPASLDSEQLGVPTVPGTSGVIGLRLGYVLEHTERCVFVGPIGPCLRGEKAERKISSVKHYSRICRQVPELSGDPGTGEIL